MIKMCHLQVNNLVTVSVKFDENGNNWLRNHNKFLHQIRKVMNFKSTSTMHIKLIFYKINLNHIAKRSISCLFIQMLIIINFLIYENVMDLKLINILSLHFFE